MFVQRYNTCISVGGTCRNYVKHVGSFNNNISHGRVCWPGSPLAALLSEPSESGPQGRFALSIQMSKMATRSIIDTQGRLGHRTTEPCGFCQCSTLCYSHVFQRLVARKIQLEKTPAVAFLFRRMKKTHAFQTPTRTRPPLRRFNLSDCSRCPFPPVDTCFFTSVTVSLTNQLTENRIQYCLLKLCAFYNC